MKIAEVKEKAKEKAEIIEHKIEDMSNKYEAKEKIEKALNNNKAPYLYLGLAAGSILASVLLFKKEKKEEAIFVGLWPPTILALGAFHKLFLQKIEDSGNNRKKRSS